MVVSNEKNRGWGDFNSKENLVELVYSIIKNRKGNRITAKQIEVIGSKHKARHAINHLLKENRIKRIRILGVNRIEYSYKIITIHTKNKKNSNNNLTNYTPQ